MNGYMPSDADWQRARDLTGCDLHEDDELDAIIVDEVNGPDGEEFLTGFLAAKNASRARIAYQPPRKSNGGFFTVAVIVVFFVFWFGWLVLFADTLADTGCAHIASQTQTRTTVITTPETEVCR